MIGTAYFENLCAFYFAMLGFIWMLVDSVYHVIRPLESPGKNVPDESGDVLCSSAKCDLRNQPEEKSNYVQETLEKSLGETKCDLDSFNRNILRRGSRVNPEVNYLSKQNLNSAAKNSLLERRLVLKRPYQEKYSLPSGFVSNDFEKPLNLIIVKNSFKKKSEKKNDLVFSIREITKFINRNILVDTTENSLILTTHTSENSYRNVSVNSSIRNMNIGLEAKRKKSQSFLDQPQELMSRKRKKLDNDQMLALRKTAHYIINHLDIEVKSHLKNQFKEMEISDLFEINEDYSSLRVKRTKNNVEPNVIITEIDSTDEIEALTKQNHQRSKKIKKKCRKSKYSNQKVEPNSAFFSSKQCFERLAYFMSTNQGLTQSKMMFEIEKELKPIKDQISELRESMTDFVVVNHRTNDRGVKTSKLSVQPIERSTLRSRSILTVSSLSLQRLARLADFTNNYHENGCPKITESEPKKLSPLAEMYVKLSRQ